MKIISEKELASLLRSSLTLRYLEAGGVDNWTWYGENFDEEYDEIIEMNDEELTKDYKNYEVN